MAAGEAAYSKTKKRRRVNNTYKLIVAAGGLFILGLLLLIRTATVAIYNNGSNIDKNTTVDMVLLKVG